MSSAEEVETLHHLPARPFNSHTAHQVRIWKTHAAAAAPALSSETELEVWGTAIESLADRAGK